MDRKDRFSPSGPFSPSNQPDEGYSEDPINTSLHSDLPSLFASLRSPADLPSWLADNASLLPVSIKTGKYSLALPEAT